MRDGLLTAGLSFTLEIPSAVPGLHIAARHTPLWTLHTSQLKIEQQTPVTAWTPLEPQPMLCDLANTRAAAHTPPAHAHGGGNSGRTPTPGRRKIGITPSARAHRAPRQRAERRAANGVRPLPTAARAGCCGPSRAGFEASAACCPNGPPWTPRGSHRAHQPAHACEWSCGGVWERCHPLPRRSQPRSVHSPATWDLPPLPPPPPPPGGPPPPPPHARRERTQG